jgi:hypothetical protein
MLYRAVNIYPGNINQSFNVVQGNNRRSFLRILQYTHTHSVGITYRLAC